ncbi:band 4.1-like protein 3 [Clytia hemisphaerica]|uniref:FERM domain-containing protein n=1 Tax=Clytia hemisphaerica TaxID=252671 RepID=A0A7M6DL37_9CNID|eukprot:TCONS_00004306-protein
MPKFQVSSCTVEKLDGEDIIIDIKNLHNGQELLDEVCKTIGLEESPYFGLRYNHPKDDQVSWFDASKPLKRQLQKASHKFKFGVQFYPSNIHELKNEFTRYQFVLQARENFLTAYWSCSLPTQALLASYVAQAEFGDYDSMVHNKDYLNDLCVMQNQSEEFLEKVNYFHQKHTNLSKVDVDWLYLENSQKTALFGMEAYDIWDSDQNLMKFGLSSSGIHILHMNTVLHTFLWPTVMKCHFKKNEIFIKLKVGEKTVRVVFIASSATEAKRIVTSCMFIKYFALNGKRKVVQYKKKKPSPTSGNQQQPPSSDVCPHNVDEDEPETPPFKRVDSKRFSKRFLPKTESLSIDLPADDSDSIIANREERHHSIKEDLDEKSTGRPSENEEQSPVGSPEHDTGDVYLGYPNNIQVPTITQTAPSENSLDKLDTEEEEDEKALEMEKQEPTEDTPPKVDGPETPKTVDDVTITEQKDDVIADEENVEIIEVVDIDYVENEEHAGAIEKGDANTTKTEEVTTKVVEIRIVTSENDKLFDNADKKDVGNGDLKVILADGAESARSNQEVMIVYGEETLESLEGSLEAHKINRGSTLLESIEKVLSESFEIVKEEDSFAVENEEE